ncbi:integrin beta-PS-like isoform X2 [Littorina saxatilis]|uniref:Integrin beta n=1 Tax=Littorina saxatilis TaxID=31220 RepID=A0AAN9BNN3_9CAEN
MMTMRRGLAAALILVALVCVKAQGGNNPCVREDAQKSCSACISTASECGWCLVEDYEKPRCDKIQNHARPDGCDPSAITSPQDSLYLEENVKVRDGELPEDAVQLQPQRVKIKIRPNKPVRIPITFRQAENYPVDLYYLMDLSNSMEDDKTKLAELGNLIAERMSAITKNFRLGFGSFVDKVVMPYVSTVPRKLKVPCRTSNGDPCEAPYGFKNHLSLDLDTSQFAQQVMSASVSGNLDAPEGGFDAIMQAVACENEIGWRSVSRRMMVFSTDAGFHYAGDGKLGGIVKPNDGHCHMSNNLYTESSNQDYPSVSQVTSKLKEKSVSIIFAVTKDQFSIYEKLAKVIESSTTGELANDSANIVDLIEDNYNKITSFVQLKSENVGKNISVKFFSRCFGEDEAETDTCEKLKIGQNVTFSAEVTVTQCPKDRKSWKQELSIYPAGLAERLFLELDIICECECENADNEIPNSPKCFDGNGTYECGVCSCNPGRYGENCECDSSEVSSKESDKKCLGNSTVPCSGRGQCVCGKCVCNPGYGELYCQCDNQACDYTEFGICGGSERGVCNCGVCECNPGYEGDTCSCRKGNSSCVGSNGMECSGHGKCSCNQCFCDAQYMGPTCDDCPACPGKCEENKACVQCAAFDSGPLTEEQCNRDCRKDLIHIQSELPNRPGIRKCQFKDDDDCLFSFTYQYMPNGEVDIVVQRTKSCPESVNVLAIVGGVVGGIVAVGLALLLIWKLLTFIHDRREFAKFENERQHAKWDTGGNPIYKQATSTFTNPTYSGKQG